MYKHAWRQAVLLARREARQGKVSFLLSVLTTMLASTMLSAVLGLGDSMRTTLSKDARTLLGGHFELRLAARNFTDGEIEWLQANSDRISKITSLRAVAFTDKVSSLLQVRAVDKAYPLFGKLVLTSTEQYSHELLQTEVRNGIAGIISTDLAGSLGIGLGERFELGATEVEVVALMEGIPDPNATMMLNAPVAFIALANLPATGLEQPGVLKSARIRVDIGSRDAVAWRQQLNKTYPESDWRVRGTDRVVPGLQNLLGRMETLLLLVSLGTMLIAGTCVGNTVSMYLRSRTTSIAVLRSLGMPAARIRLSYWLVTMLFVLAGGLLGLPAGLLCQQVVLEFLSGHLPFEVTSSFSYRNTVLVPVIALLVAWIFASRPLHIFSRVSPTTLFSLSSGQAIVAQRMPPSAWLEMAVPGSLLALALVFAATDKMFLLYFGVGGALATLLFRLLAVLMVKLLSKARPNDVAKKIALRSITRGSDQIIAASVSLGIGLTALLTFSLTEANFNHQLNANLAIKSPDYYLAGLQPGDVGKLRTATAAWLPTKDDFRTLPIHRARITHLNNVPVDEIDPPENFGWIIRGDRFITWARDPANQWTGTSRVFEGEEWGPDDDRLLVSFDMEAAKAFGLTIGDPIAIRILGKDYQVTIANLRRIEWSSFDVNFVMVLSDGPWEDEPHGLLGSVRNISGNHFDYQRKVVEIAPSVTPIRTKTIVASVTKLISKIGLLLNLITLTATVAGVFVLAAAIAEGRHRRAHDSIVLRIIGTSRTVLTSVFRMEFLVIAALAAVPSLVVATLAAYSVTHLLLGLPWRTDWLTALTVMASTLAIVLLLGTLNTMRLVRTPPLMLLRND